MNLRLRLVMGVVLAAGVTVGGVVLERELGVRPAVSSSPVGEEVSGGWVCPHGGGEGWRAWVTLANPSPTDAVVLITTFGPDGTTERQEAAVRAGASTSVEVPAEDMATASEVEFFGAPVAAGMVVVRPEDAGLGAEPCAHRPGRRVRLVDGSSERGQEAWVVLANPAAVDAVVDVTLVTEERVVRPGALHGILLPAGAAEALNLNRYALGERTLSAVAEATLGRVSAALVGVRSPRGVRLSVGSASTGPARYLPGGADDALGKVVVMAERRQVPFRIRIQGLTAQEEAVDEAAVPAGRVRTVEVTAAEAGLVVAAAGDVVLTAARRTERREVEDQGSTAGVSAPAAGWVIPPPVGPDGGRQFLILQNPGPSAVTATVVLLRAAGPRPGPAGGTVTVDGGRARIVPLTSESGGPAVGALVETAEGGLVAAMAGVTEGGYAVTVGVRLDSFGRPETDVSS